MKNELMLFESRGKILVNSRVVAERFNKEHKNILRDIGNLMAQNCAVKSMFLKSEYVVRGKKFPEYLMDRDGFSLLVMGFTGKGALNWKLKYIEAFNTMETALRERQTTDWLKTRKKGKLIRREETDAIQLLIPYAEEQGSKNARMFYVNYSKMVNKAVGLESGEREHASHKTLMLIALMEDIISNTIAEEMERNTYYKAIYQKCKSKIECFVALAYLKAS